MSAHLNAKELRKHIQAIKNLKLEVTDLDFLKEQLLPIVGSWLHISPIVNYGQLVFRGVHWGEKPINKKQLSYPPAEIIKTFQRVNRPHEPMFYCSVGCHSTILELAPQTGDRIAISTWRIIKPLYLNSLGYAEDIFRDAGSSEWDKKWWVQRRNEDPQILYTNENKLVHDFLNREFTKKVLPNATSQYKTTVAISELFLKELKLIGQPQIENPYTNQTEPADDFSQLELSGLLYPSVANALNADNLALKPEIVDQCLELVSVQYIEIIKKAESKEEYESRGLDYSDTISNSGEIEWNGSFPDHLVAGTDYHIEFDGNCPILRDSKGVEVGRFPV